MDQEILDTILNYVITGVVLPLLGYAVFKFKAYLDSKIAVVENNDLRNGLADANDELERAVRIAVADVAETFVKALKAEGKFGKEDAIEASKIATEKTKEIMSDMGLNMLEIVEVNVDSAIKSLIEVNVAETKQTIAISSPIACENNVATLEIK